MPQLLSALAEHMSASSIVLPFERTVGDEVQGVVADPDAVLAVVTTLARHGDWHAGIGFGSVETPLPRSTREARGEAFVDARDAIGRTAVESMPIGLLSRREPDLAAAAEGVLLLLHATLSRRSANGWEAVDLIESQPDQRAVAAQLGVTPQAVSKRLIAAEWRVSQRGELAARRLLQELVDALAT